VVPSPTTLSFNKSHDSRQCRVLTNKTRKTCQSSFRTTRHESSWLDSTLGREHQALALVQDQCAMFCARKQEKILPAAAIREICDEQAAKIAEQQGRPLGRKQRNQLRDEVLLQLLPKALSKSTYTFAYLDLSNRWLIVDASSSSKAEELIALLRQSLGELPAVLPKLKGPISDAVTMWLSTQETPAGFAFTDTCELRSSVDDSIIRCRNLALDSEEISQHLATGKYLSKIGLSWQDRLEFVLHEDCSIKQLKPSDLLRESFENSSDADAQFDQDFALMRMEFASFLHDLMLALGGEAEDRL